MSRFAPLARVERGGRVESWHRGAAAVVTPEGRLVARLGDPRVATFMRSAAKPFQALPLVERGGRERFGLDAADLALLCASHFGLPEHVEGVSALLARGGLTPESLRCGTHWPFDREARRRLRDAGERPTVLHNNCSGKHTGMLLACLQAGWPLDGYLDPAHPLQREILATVAELAGMPAEAIETAVDGCGAPCFRLPLAAAARAFAALAAPELAAVPPGRVEALGAIAAAMAAAPEMVAGRGQFTTRLIETTAGRVVGKEGAEGYYGAAVRGPAALGVVVKVADGGERCRPGAVLETLRQAGALAAAELDELSEWHTPEVRNRNGEAGGRIVPELELVTRQEGAA